MSQGTLRSKRKETLLLQEWLTSFFLAGMPLGILVHLFVLIVNSTVSPHWKTLELVTLSQKHCTCRENRCQLDTPEPTTQSLPAPGIIAHFKLADYKTFQESSRRPQSAVLVYSLCASFSLKTATKKIFLLHEQKASIQHTKLLFSTERSPLSVGFQDTGMGSWFLCSNAGGHLLPDPWKQPDK